MYTVGFLTRRIISILIVSLIAGLGHAYADESVGFYQKKDGTYVEQHKRTKSDRLKNNNHSSEGRTNPYTGKKGRVKNKPKPMKAKKVKQPKSKQ